MSYTVSRCILCGHEPVDAVADGRVVTTSCTACGAILAIEFNPPDEPGLRARIERIDQAHDRDLRRNASHPFRRSFRVRSR
jgi:uncharacterized Zn finger protein